MKFKSIFTLLAAAIISCNTQQVLSETEHRELETSATTPVVVNCGDENTNPMRALKTWDIILICLVFPDFPGGLKKVVFKTRIDKF